MPIAYTTTIRETSPDPSTWTPPLAPLADPSTCSPNTTAGQCNSRYDLNLYLTKNRILGQLNCYPFFFLVQCPKQCLGTPDEVGLPNAPDGIPNNFTFSSYSFFSNGPIDLFAEVSTIQYSHLFSNIT